MESFTREDFIKERPSAYNKFMKIQMAKVKTEFPALSHRLVFIVAASRWKDAIENAKKKELTQ